MISGHSKRGRGWLTGAFTCLTLTTLIGGAVFLFPWDSAEVAQAGVPTNMNALAVTQVSPRETVWPNTIEAYGVISPWQEATISAQVGGYQIIDVLADVGDVVKKGQVVAVLNPAILKAEEAQLKAKHDQAVANRKRAATLKAKGNLSEKDLLQNETDEKSTRALLASNQLQLGYTSVVAPDAGIITSRTATLGAVSEIGGALFQMIRQGRLEWRGEVPAAELSRVAPGQRVELHLPNGATAIAKIRQIAPTVDSSSRLGMIYADIELPSAAIAGMYTSGKIFVGMDPAIVIPATSVILRDGRNQVARLTGENETSNVTLQAVTTGRYAGNEVEIVEGLTPADIIVDSGAGLLNDGDTVRVIRPAETEQESVQ